MVHTAFFPAPCGLQFHLSLEVISCISSSQRENWLSFPACILQNCSQAVNQFSSLYRKTDRPTAWAYTPCFPDKPGYCLAVKAEFSCRKSLLTAPWKINLSIMKKLEGNFTILQKIAVDGKGENYFKRVWELWFVSGAIHCNWISVIEFCMGQVACLPLERLLKP